jgi:hypothetical protein
MRINVYNGTSQVEETVMNSHIETIAIQTGNGEPIPNQPTDVFEPLRSISRPPTPVPEESLYLLFEMACGTTRESRVTRAFLYWLIGQVEPTGYRGAGGVELRRLDDRCRQAALDVLT